MLTATTVLCVSLSFTCGQKGPSYTYGDKANLIQALPNSRHKASPGPPHIPCHQIMLMTENYLILLRVPQCISSLAIGGKPTKTTPCVMCSLPFLWYIRSFLNQLTSESLAVEVFLKPVFHWGRGALSCCDGDGCLSNEIYAERGAKDLPRK